MANFTKLYLLCFACLRLLIACGCTRHLSPPSGNFEIKEVEKLPGVGRKSASGKWCTPGLDRRLLGRRGEHRNARMTHLS